MKKTVIIAGNIITTLSYNLILLATEKIDSTPYFESRYFKTSVPGADSLAKK